MKHNTKEQLVYQRKKLSDDHSNANQRNKLLKKEKTQLLPINEVSILLVMRCLFLICACSFTGAICGYLGINIQDGLRGMEAIWQVSVLLCLCFFCLMHSLYLRFLNIHMELSYIAKKKKDILHLRSVATEAQYLKEEAERRLAGEDMSEGDEDQSS